METEVAKTMLEHVTSGLTTVITWAGTVIDALITTDGQLAELAPLWAIGIAVSALLLGAKIIKSFVWGS